jgi:hypothetical protein
MREKAVQMPGGAQIKRNSWIINRDAFKKKIVTTSGIILS